MEVLHVEPHHISVFYKIFWIKEEPVQIKRDNS